MTSFVNFWEIEEPPLNIPMLGLAEHTVVQHFKANCSRTHKGRFVVPLPRKSDAGIIGESRSQAVSRFTSLERSLTRKGCFQDFDVVMQEYLDLGQAGWYQGKIWLNIPVVSSTYQCMQFTRPLVAQQRSGQLSTPRPSPPPAYP